VTKPGTVPYLKTGDCPRFSGLGGGLLLAALLHPFTPSFAAPDAALGEQKSQVCIACHGPAGNPTDPEIPSLAAQPPTYVFYQLIQFREERRKDSRMSPFAAKLTDADMKDIGEYFSRQKPAPLEVKADAAKAAAGKSVADRFHCGSCHTPSYGGQNHIARLAGQSYTYLVKELRGFKTGARPDIDGSMASAAQPLTDDDIQNVSHYLATLR
jgi:cytochrome c553